MYRPKRHRQRVRSLCCPPQVGGGFLCPDCCDFLLKGEGGGRRFFLRTYICADDLGEFLGHGCRPLCEQDFQICVDQIKVDRRVAQTLLIWQQILLYEREGERRVAPAVLEDAVNAVEEEENTVHLRHGKLNLARAERLDSDGVRARELK